MRPMCLAAALACALSGCAHSAPVAAKAIALNRDGARAIASGDLERAEARIALALEYNPRFTEAWVNLGLVEMMRGNFVRARHDFIRARDLNPDLPAPHHALGLLADHEGRADDAARHYRAALKVDPGFAPARINLARRLFERGDIEEAREHFLRTTEVAPGFVDGWTGLCEALLRLDRQDDAEQALAAARRRFPGDPSLELLEARMLLRRGAFAKAEARLGALTRAGDKRLAAQAISWVAVARLGEGDPAGAIDAAEHAISLEPGDAVARYALRSALDSVNVR